MDTKAFDPKRAELNRQRSVSVAVAFGDAEALRKLGSGVAELACPACGARGQRYGNPGEEMRFAGFEPLSSGGLGFILARCKNCDARVTLPHTKA